MIVNNDHDVNVFSDSDARRQCVFPNACCTKYESVANSNDSKVSSDVNTVVRTRYFYSTKMGKKCVKGLMARGRKESRRKALVIADQSHIPVTVNTRVFKNRFEHKSSDTTGHNLATTPTRENTNVQQCVIGVIDCIPTTHNGVPENICSKSHTLNGDNGIVIDKSVTPTANNGDLGFTHLSQKLSFDNSVGVKPVYDSALGGGGNNNKPVKTCHEVENRPSTVNSSISVNQDHYTLLYDVNADQGELNWELCNTLWFKNGWKKCKKYLDSHFPDFSLWRKQTDYQFGFVPLSNLVLPENIGHIGDKVRDPIERHFWVKATGIPNFLGARIPIDSQLNVEEWRNVLANYWDKQLIHLIQFGSPLTSIGNVL